MAITPQIAKGVHEFVFSIAADAQRGYPSGELVFSIDLEDPMRARVTALSILLAGRNSWSTSSSSFDDGCVVVRRDTENRQLQSLQIMHYAPGPAFVPELVDEVESTGDRFMLDAVATGMVLWAMLEKACEVIREALKEHSHQAWMRQSPSSEQDKFWAVA